MTIQERLVGVCDVACRNALENCIGVAFTCCIEDYITEISLRQGKTIVIL